MSFTHERMIAVGSEFSSNVTLFRCFRGQWGSSVHDVLKYLGHDAYVRGVAFLPCDRRFVSCSGDCTAKVWDVQTQTTINTISTHHADVNGIATLSLSHNVFATASSDCTVKLHDTRSQSVVASFGGFTSDVNEVKFHMSGLRLVAGSDDFTCRVFDLRKNKELRKLTLDNCVNTCDFWTSPGQTSECIVVASGDDLYLYNDMPILGKGVNGNDLNAPVIFKGGYDDNITQLRSSCRGHLGCTSLDGSRVVYSLESPFLNELCKNGANNQ